jgi:hypothetical protein
MRNLLTVQRRKSFEASGGCAREFGLDRRFRPTSQDEIARFT